jgi:hypothetical protein
MDQLERLAVAASRALALLVPDSPAALDLSRELEQILPLTKDRHVTYLLMRDLRLHSERALPLVAARNEVLKLQLSEQQVGSVIGRPIQDRRELGNENAGGTEDVQERSVG